MQKKRSKPAQNKATAATTSPEGLSKGKRITQPQLDNGAINVKQILNSSQARQLNAIVCERHSRNSFYISEDSQRTLTPLTCKDDMPLHCQGKVVHRGNKFLQM